MLASVNPRATDAVKTYVAKSCEISASGNPKLVVRTVGAVSCAMRVLTRSRKPPRSPPPLSEPTVKNVVGTLVAIPTVY